MNASRPASRFPYWQKIVLPALVLLILACGAGGYYYWKNWENPNHEKPDWGGRPKPVFYRNALLEGTATGTKDSLKLPITVYKELIDPRMRYEDSSQSVIVTTADQVVRMRVGEHIATVNDKPVTLSQTVENNGKIVYLPVDPLKTYYTAKFTESADTGAVIVNKEGDEIRWGKANANPKRKDKTSALRANPSIKSPIYTDVGPGDPVTIWGENGDWLSIQLPNGYSGYMKKTDVQDDHTEVIPVAPHKVPFDAWKPAGGAKVNLTWQQVSPKNPDTAAIPQMPGLNVISPQWFNLTDGEGNIKSLADASFSKWAHSRNYQVWALFANGFDLKRTSAALATYDKRMKMTKQLIDFAKTYDLQGINVDFENVNLKDKDNLVQFVRELTPMLHEEKIAVSIDVTVKDGSENYSLFMDRKSIAESVDYMMVMAYDEYWASSPKAGSVASLPWVEQGIQKILKEDEVPPSKMLLGVPYYTRIWTEQTKNGKPSVSSKAVSMDAVLKLIKDKQLKPVFQPETGQNYVEYQDGDAVVKIWIEDATSMKSRMELVKKYNLAGIASWSRGFETPDVWTTIADTLKQP